MTLKDKRKTINRAFYEWMAKNYPKYQMDDSEYGQDGNVAFFCGVTENSISYHISQHYVIAFNWCDEETKRAVDEMNLWLKNKVKEVVGETK